MVIDTSAIAAILLGEPERESFASAIAADARRLVSAVTRVEAAFVLEGRKQAPGREMLERFLALVAPEIVPVTGEQASLAIQAFRRFGKGRHPAGLNIGDCFAYALAAATGEPVLFKGDDFSRTDLRPAAPRTMSPPEA